MAVDNFRLAGFNISHRVIDAIGTAARQYQDTGAAVAMESEVEQVPMIAAVAAKIGQRSFEAEFAQARDNHRLQRGIHFLA